MIEHNEGYRECHCGHPKHSGKCGVIDTLITGAERECVCGDPLWDDTSRDDIL